jgi:hypothetical protein
MLVRGGGAFYNPRITRAAAMVSFTRITCTQTLLKLVMIFRQRVLEY